MRAVEAHHDDGGFGNVGKIRDRTDLSKEAFDRAMLDLHQRGDVTLHYHDAPGFLSAAERDRLVYDPGTKFYDPSGGGQGKDVKPGTYYATATPTKRTTGNPPAGLDERGSRERITSPGYTPGPITRRAQLAMMAGMEARKAHDAAKKTRPPTKREIAEQARYEARSAQQARTHAAERRLDAAEKDRYSARRATAGQELKIARAAEVLAARIERGHGFSETTNARDRERIRQLRNKAFHARRRRRELLDK